VPPELPVDRVVEDYVYRFHHKLFPVVARGRLAGCIDAKHIKDVPKENWAEVLAEEIMMPCSAENCIGPDDDALKALSIMRRSETGRLMVVEGGNLVGVVALKDLLEFFALKIDLEGLK
ncbi:MAG: CBS domain-containing protein, partial [Kiloniellales bacterium]|nr:CBS domain-containing protein [Kiloniellales bacterium]